MDKPKRSVLSQLLYHPLQHSRQQEIIRVEKIDKFAFGNCQTCVPRSRQSLILLIDPLDTGITSSILTDNLGGAIG